MVVFFLFVFGCAFLATALRQDLIAEFWVPLVVFGFRPRCGFRHRMRFGHCKSRLAKQLSPETPFLTLLFLYYSFFLEQLLPRQATQAIDCRKV